MTVAKDIEAQKKHRADGNDLEHQGDYDPFKHRIVEHPTTTAETFLHVLKGSLGTGILSMPLAFHHSGYIIGIIGTIIVGFICTYCVHLMIRAQYELCKRRKIPSLTYPALAETSLEEGTKFFKTLAPYASKVVNGFLIIYQLGACCVYTVFIATNVKDVADQHMDEWSLEIWMLIILLPLILVNYIRNLKYLAPFSTVANCITIGSFGIILYYLIEEGMTFEGRVPVGNVADFTLFLGTVLFALECIGVILPLENEMKSPRSFGAACGVINVGMFSIVTLYVGMGLLGYLSFGPGVAETLTLNLEKTAIPAQAAKICLAAAIFVSHPLQMYVAIDIIWYKYLANTSKMINRHKLFWEYLVRTVLVLFTFGLAVAIPRIGLFISLVGSFCLSALGLAFPAIIDMSTFWYSLSGIRKYIMVTRNCALVIFGGVALVIGTWISVQEIVKSFN